MFQSTKIEVPGATGARLAARLDQPPNPCAFALFAQCFTCGKDIFAATRHPRSFPSRGSAEHLLRRREDAIDAATAMAAWAWRYRPVAADAEQPRGEFHA